MIFNSARCADMNTYTVYFTHSPNSV